MRSLTALLLAASLTACCPKPQQCPETRTAADEAAPAASAAAKVPAFPLAALRGPHALRAKLYLKPDGTLRKYAVYVAKSAIPAWVLAMADKELGQGEDVDFEVEQYENGDTVYEVTRKVGGKTVELSVHSETRKKLYTEAKDLPLDGAPEAIKQAVGKVAGFAADADGLEIKTYADRKVFEVHGKLEGRALTIYFAEDGAILSRSHTIPTKLKIDL
jgi:uncharacterized membrane protein YkoI